MSWVITEEFSGHEPEAVGVVGPRGTSETMDSILENENKVKFRMYSDDDDLDYEGYWLDDIDADCELDPLDDFGMPNAGCTILRVLENGKWVMV